MDYDLLITGTVHTDIEHFPGTYAVDDTGTLLFVIALEDLPRRVAHVFVGGRRFYRYRYGNGTVIFKAAQPLPSEQPEQPERPFQVGDLVAFDRAGYGMYQSRINGLLGSPPRAAYFEGWGTTPLEQCRLISPAQSQQQIHITKGEIFQFVAEGCEKIIILT